MPTRPPQPQHWRALRRLLSGGHPGCDPQALVPAARAGQVLPLLADLAPSVREVAEEDLTRRLFVHMHVEQAARRVAAALDGVAPVAALKGNATAYLVYARPEHRLTVDVDLLVADGDFDAAVEALRADGWRDAMPETFQRVHRGRHHEWALARTFGPVTVPVDVHRRLARGARFSPDHAGILARARPAAGAPLPICDPEDALLHTCLHAATSGWDVPLKAWVDAARLAAHPEVDLARCAERAWSWRMAAALWAGLRIARRWLDAPVPEAVLEALRPPAAHARALDLLLSGDGPTPLRWPDLPPRVSQALTGPLAADDGRARRAWVRETASELILARLPRR